MSQAHHNPESKAAYESIKEHMPSLERQILNYIRHRGSATCEEVERGLNMKHQTASSTICYLMKKEALEILPARGRTSTGRTCRIYAIRYVKPTPQGGNYEFPF